MLAVVNTPGAADSTDSGQALHSLGGKEQTGKRVHMVMAVEVRYWHAGVAHLPHLRDPFVYHRVHQGSGPAHLVDGILPKVTVRSEEWSEVWRAGQRSVLCQVEMH